MLQQEPSEVLAVCWALSRGSGGAQAALGKAAATLSLGGESAQEGPHPAFHGAR